MTNSKPTVDRAEPDVMSGAVWEELCETLRRSAERVVGDGVPDTPRDRAEGFRYLTRFLQAGIVSCVAHDDADYPVFGRMIDYTMPWGLDCPDCLYLYAPVRGGASYRIAGNRGTANHIDFQVNWGHYANGDISTWGTIDSKDGSELETDADGGFELVLSEEPRAQNRLALAPNAEFVLVRQYFNDWEVERPADLLIEREGATEPVPPPTTQEVKARLEKLMRWLEKGGALWERMSRAFLALEPNSLILHMPEAAGARSGMRGQAYGMGNFRCGPEEAVIVELTPPTCRHWSISLANGYWECIEYASRQSSLNGHQARLDSDGVFRGVVAHHDPGVPNWLDTSGHTQGTITARFLQAQSAPEVRFRVVAHGDVREMLPRDTPVLDPEARTLELTRRRRAVLRRFRR